VTSRPTRPKTNGHCDRLKMTDLLEQNVCMDEVRLPIFIANNEDDDLTIAPSVISALGNMEPPEVSGGHYFVFDASGRQGHLAIEPFNIVITAWTTAADLPALRSRIQKCLVYYHLEIDQNMNDAEYIQRAAPLIFNENIKNQWPKRPRWLRTLVHGKQSLPSFPEEGQLG